MEKDLFDCRGATRVESHYADDRARHVGVEPPHGILCVASAHIAPQDRQQCPCAQLLAALVGLGLHPQG